MIPDLPEPPAPTRRPYRPPIGIPVPGEPRARAAVVSVALHALLFLAVVAPTLFISSRLVDATQQGAGGPGPVGGGGGGNRGDGRRERLPYVQERLDYLQVQPPEPVPKTKEEIPTPKIEPPKPAPPPPPVEETPAPVPPPVTATADSSGGAGTGTSTGTGSDGSAGDGPGRGGGVGSGVGTGRGSGSGPGRGGGEGDIYPPTVVALPILPLPIPSKVRPYKMVARFEVDEQGNATLLDFNPSRDSGYNKRIREMLAEIRFRPAVGMDGRPVRAIAVVTAEAM